MLAGCVAGRQHAHDHVGGSRTACPVLSPDPWCPLQNRKHFDEGLEACINSTGVFRQWLTLSRKAVHGSPNVPLHSWVKLAALHEGAPGQKLWDLLPPRGLFDPPAGTGRADPIPQCAAVASAARMKGSKLGRRIDSHDLVLRFNRAPTRGYEEDVGSKTHVRWTNQLFMGWREQPWEAVVTKWPRKRTDLSRALSRKAHILNPRFVRWATDPAAFQTGGRSSGGDKPWVPQTPTSGYLAVLMLMLHCERVFLYGFRTDGSKMKDWYYHHAHSRRQTAAGRAVGSSPASDWIYVLGDKGAGNGAGSSQHDDLDLGPTDRDGPANLDFGAMNPTGGVNVDGGRNDDVWAWFGAQGAGAVGPRGRRLLHIISVERRCLAEYQAAGMVDMVIPQSGEGEEEGEGGGAAGGGGGGVERAVFWVVRSGGLVHGPADHLRFARCSAHMGWMPCVLHGSPQVAA
eukprot:jgi/Mesvir1/4817/Mv11106-RA.1